MNLKKIKKYKHLFFDLDKTLWDFENNSKEALSEIFDLYQLSDQGINNKEKFLTIYRIINEKCWDLYKQKKITRDELRSIRFTKTLNYFKIKNVVLGEQMSESYLEKSSNKTHLKENCIEILNYLFPKYQMHIITNGFEEVQHKKIKNSGLSHFFINVFTSEAIGSPKPDDLIFKYALIKSGASFDETLMIGDDWRADMEGAKNVYMDHVYYSSSKLDPYQNPTYHISNLLELKSIL